MRIEDEAVLDAFRKAGYCEICYGYTCRLDPHHYLAKGIGSGSRIDLRINLIALCRQCHDETHKAHIKRATILDAIAQREGVTADQITESLRAIRALPKNSPREVWEQLLPKRK